MTRKENPKSGSDGSDRSAELTPLLRVYDLQPPGARQQAHRHLRLWGRPYTDVHALGADRVALVFRPGGERWHPWEGVRLRWILGQNGEGKEDA